MSHYTEFVVIKELVAIKDDTSLCRKKYIGENKQLQINVRDETNHD